MSERYTAVIKLRDGNVHIVTGTLDDCTAAVHGWGNMVQSAKIKRAA